MPCSLIVKIMWCKGHGGGGGGGGSGGGGGGDRGLGRGAILQGVSAYVRFVHQIFPKKFKLFCVLSESLSIVVVTHV